MANDVEIANLALAMIGDDPITALNEDSERASLINREYKLVRDALLREYPWNFATSRAVLAQEVQAPAWGYKYQYTLPGDCLRVLELSKAKVNYRIEGRKLLTDETSVKIKYTARVEDPGVFDAMFVDVFATRLAIDLAMGISKKPELATTLWQLYERKLGEARSMDSMENPPRSVTMTTLLDVR